MHFNAGLRARGHACICERVYVCMFVCVYALQCQYAGMHVSANASMFVCLVACMHFNACILPRVYVSARVCVYGTLCVSVCLRVCVSACRVLCARMRLRVRKLACKPVSV
jgi:hypothetical protein